MIYVLIIAFVLIFGVSVISKKGFFTSLKNDFLLRISLSFAVAGIGCYALKAFTEWSFFRVLTSICAVGAVAVVVIDIIMHLLNVSSSDS